MTGFVINAQGVMARPGGVSLAEDVVALGGAVVQAVGVDAPPTSPSPGAYMLTEYGDWMITESGNRMIVE